MKKPIVMFFVIAICGQAFGAGHDPKVIIPLLKTSKISLLQGIAYAEKTSGPATSAKFEVGDDGKLALSIYTVPEGLRVQPENATLTEISGAASEGYPGLKAEVFTDKEHIARASVHMTLFQLSKANLIQVIARALRIQPGIPIDVRNPMVQNHRAVAEVVIVGKGMNVYNIKIDLQSGQSLIRKN